MESEGFRFDTSPQNNAKNDERWERQVVPALRRYKELEGDMLVPRDFVVPSSSDDWPEEMWGMRLGRTVDSIRSSGTFVRGHADRRELLESEGFAWELRRSPAEKLRAAEAHYGRVRSGALRA